MPMMMGKCRVWLRLAAALTAALVASGCAASLYDDAGNWAMQDSDSPEFFSEYDVFYLYPSMLERTDDGYLNWLREGVRGEVRRTVQRLLAKQFGPRVRLFSPFVPQLDQESYRKLLKSAAMQDKVDWTKTSLRSAIACAVEALEHCMERKSPDQPLVLLGHGQGALILYEAMKLCPKINPENGFVAAYFFGIPWITPGKIVRDFGSRGIRPATGRSDIGVVAVCNIMSPGEKLENTLGMPGGAVINPLNWRTDGVPALPAEHPGALFRNGKTGSSIDQVRVLPRFCGAVIDTERSLVCLTHVRPEFVRRLEVRKADCELVGVFGMCVSRNAGERVRIWHFQRKGLKLPAEL